MKTITIKKGLDIPARGEPRQEICQGREVRRVALVGEDYLGLKPTMEVQVGDRVTHGQVLFTDKKNPGVKFTAPASGTVEVINRGPKRKFQSLVIAVEGEQAREFPEAVAGPVEEHAADNLRELLIDSGLWTSLRTRPYGKIPGPAASPSSLFVSAIDSSPLAADPLIIIGEKREMLERGLLVLHQMLNVPIHLCMRPEGEPVRVEGVECWGIEGPHPAGLPSTHIHCIDPVGVGKEVWHICCQDVARIGYLFTHGRLSNEIIIALGGEGFTDPRLVRTVLGATLAELTEGEIVPESKWRMLSGSILDGRISDGPTAYLGRYHRQVSTLREDDGSTLFGWMSPGKKRFSLTGLFTSALEPPDTRFPFLTAVWGGKRAIYPLDVYDRVMPLDILPLPLLKSLSVGDTEKAAALGCLELIEEDLALCSFVCPGKNEFGPMLRNVLSTIEKEG